MRIHVDQVHDDLLLLLAFVIGTLAVTRLVRLIVDDTWPPMLRLREQYVRRVPERWHELIECPWCVAVWIAAPAALWFASTLAWPGATWNVVVWWVINGWLAVAWAAAFLSVRDIPPDQRG